MSRTRKSLNVGARQVRHFPIGFHSKPFRAWNAPFFRRRRANSNMPRPAVSDSEFGFRARRRAGHFTSVL